jgi:hypothetical protein
VVYQRGWLEGAVDTDFYRTRSTRYDPDLIVGARLPHFWLTPINGKNTDRISSIDLPTKALKAHEEPVHLILLLNAATGAVQKLLDTLPPCYGPVEPIRIHTNDESLTETDFVIVEAPPSFLLQPVAALVRPDGHVLRVWRNDEM